MMFKSKIAVLASTLLLSGVAVSADINTGLVAHWSFDDCTATDVSGNGHDGVINGTPQCVTGINGEALQFNGISDFIEIADTPELRLSGSSYTLSAWVNLKGYNSSYQSSLIAKRGNGEQDGYIWALSGNAAGNPVGRPSIALSGGANPTMISTKGTPLDSWRHIVVIYDTSAQTAKLYVNNALETSATNFPTSNPNTAVSLVIAKDNTDNYYLNGIVDDVRMYNRVLTAVEIKKLYYQGNPPVIRGTAPWGTSHSVVCENLTQNTVVTLPATSASAWNCEKAGLAINHGDKVTITIKGKKY